ncbi:MAG: ABC transporter ATP-binding protein [Planctomycetes bacterium]|nr:ABC transporter ATP-binding protein [Planctomycetota bacterium]
MIHLRDVSKYYDMGPTRVGALRDVSLEVSRAEYAAILGPSGSGKSTLLHVLGCLDRPSAGDYTLDGLQVGSLDIPALAEIRNRKIGFVFQRFHLMPRLTALENVALPMRFAGVRPAERERRAGALLDRVGLGDRRGHRPAELSGGQQQRVAIARALANEPPVILADEPTGNLDSQSGNEIIDLLEQLSAEGRTVLVVTHDETLARRARRIIRLLDGKLVEDSTRESG